MNTRDLIADTCNVPELLAELDKLMALMPAPLNPAALDGQDAPLTHEHSSVTVLPMVSQSDEE